MVVLYAARHRLAVPVLARWLLALGIVATLGAYVAHGWPDGPIGAAVAAWPAASLVGSYELLLWLVRTAAGPASPSQPGEAVPASGSELAWVPGEQDSGPDCSPVRPAGHALLPQAISDGVVVRQQGTWPGT
jgi:hypothetical protein